MSITDIFSIPFLICLAICILLIGCSSIYFYQKISHQDHKIESMVSLITSLAEEQIKTTQPANKPIPTTIIGGGGNGYKIPVSDDEDSSSEEEYSSSEEDETSSEEGDDSSLEEEPKIQVKELNLDNLVEEVFDLAELDSKEDEQEPFAETDIKSIHLEADEKMTDFSSVFKTININLTAEEESVGNNYKKMSLTKLREVAQSLGHGDTSKLKKNELLKLLEVE